MHSCVSVVIMDHEYSKAHWNRACFLSKAIMSLMSHSMHKKK